MKEYFKSISFGQKIVWIIMIGAFFFGMYIYSTTNRLYREDINEYLFLTHLKVWCTFLFTFVFVFYCDYKNHRHLLGFRNLVFILTVTTTFVLMMDFSPCLFRHPSDLNHAHPHTIEYTLYQSLLCPNYSQPGRLLLILFIFCGIGLNLILRNLSISKA